uniref:Uncharacterized protein n=1 Tax=Cryptomonas curvata TaxID=233186 RepID=A0A7S0MJM9_9CRYP
MVVTPEMDSLISSVSVMCKDMEKFFGNCQCMADCRPSRRVGSSPTPRKAITDCDHDNSQSTGTPPNSKGNIRFVELSMEDVKECGGNFISNQLLSNRTYSSSFASIITSDQMAREKNLSSQKFSNSFGSARTVNAKANMTDGYYPTSPLSRASSFSDGNRAPTVVPSHKSKFAILMDQARMNGKASAIRVQKAKREGWNQAEQNAMLISGSGRSQRAPHERLD